MKSHGFSHSSDVIKRKTYKAWRRLRYRCGSPSCDKYEYYGGRGIAVDPEWASSFAQFLRDMGLAPSIEHSIERIDNSKGYGPGNCRWATRMEQSNNKRSNRIICFTGQCKTIAQWARTLGVTWDSISNRVYKGWTVERTLTQPFQRGHTARSDKAPSGGSVASDKEM